MQPTAYTRQQMLPMNVNNFAQQRFGAQPSEIAVKREPRRVDHFLDLTLNQVEAKVQTKFTNEAKSVLHEIAERSIIKIYQQINKAANIRYLLLLSTKRKANK